MLYELDKTDYGKVRPLFAELETYNFSLGGVFDGSRAAKVYVDDRQNPQSAFIVSSIWFYLGGNAHNAAFNHALQTLIAGDEFAHDPIHNPDDANVYCHPDDWREQYPAIFGERPPLEGPNRRYVFRQFPFDWRARLPEGFTVRPIDKTLLENAHLQNLADVKAWVKACWEMCEETYYQQGVGVCLQHGDAIAAWCLTAAIDGNACELGIETAADFRRQGLGTLAAMATVSACLERGFTTIDWHCDDSNAGSWGVAENAGFILERKYLSHDYYYDPLFYLAATGIHYFILQQYREAIVWFQKAIVAGYTETWVYVRAARAYAQLGEKDAAFRNLQTALDKGWQDRQFLKNCADFQSLCDLPEWATILAQLQAEA